MASRMIFGEVTAGVVERRHRDGNIAFKRGILRDAGVESGELRRLLRGRRGELMVRPSTPHRSRVLRRPIEPAIRLR
jgi:hypothetical protein